MLVASDAFKEIVGLTDVSKPTFLEWEYRVIIDGITYTSDIIKSLEINGQLQNNFTIGSSLSLTLDLELLITEKTQFSELAEIKVYATLLNNDLNEEILLGTFVTIEVDRQTIGRIKISACDMMGHNNYMSSEMTFTDLGFQPEDFPLEAGVLASAIAKRFNIEIDNNIPEGNALVTNFVVLYGLTYRQVLEYLAGIYGGYVKLTREGKLSFFRFKHTGITLTQENYYNMTKGQYKFQVECITCNITRVEEVTNEETVETFTTNATLLIGNEQAKTNHTVTFTNPFITDPKMIELYAIYSDVEYYPITISAIGNCILEPGDIVTIRDHYDEEYELYIQNYKLSCVAGIKDTYESFYDYNGGSFSNSLSNSISKINDRLNSTNSFLENNYETITSGITRLEFSTTVNNLNNNISSSNMSMNKWYVEYYDMEEGNNEYDIESMLTKTPFKKELIPDSATLIATDIYRKGAYHNTLCRFYTSIYVTEDVTDTTFINSDNTTVYINGNRYPYGNAVTSFSKGWNIIELYLGKELDDNESIDGQFIEAYFYLEVPRSILEEPPLGLYVHPTSELMNKYAEDGENLNYVSIMNPQSMSIDYTRISAAERTMTVDSIVDRLSQTEIFVEQDSYGNDQKSINQKFSEVDQRVDSITTTVSSLEQTTDSYDKKFTEIETTAEGIYATIDWMNDDYNRKYSEIDADVKSVKFSFNNLNIRNNYFKNSGFMTDDYQGKYFYSTSNKATFQYLNGYDDNDIENTLSIGSNTITLGPQSNFSENLTILENSQANVLSEVKSVKCDGFFSLSQEINEKELFPPVNFESDNQLFMSVKACVLYKHGIGDVYLNFFIKVETDCGTYIYNSHEVNTSDNYDYFALGDCTMHYLDDDGGSTVFPSNLSNSKDENGRFIYKTNKPLTDKWEKHSVFINLKAFDDYQLYDRSSISKITFGFNPFIKDPEVRDEVYPTSLFIGINEPLMAITSNNTEVAYTQGQNEIFSGSTKIDSNGIEVSKNTSPIKTKIRNTGMSIYNEDTQLAYFETHAFIPELEVEKIKSDAIAIKDPNYSSTTHEIRVGIPPEDSNITCHYSTLREAFDSLPDFIDSDYLVIRVYGNLSIDRYTKLKNKKCGIIEILLEPGANIAGYPLLFANIDGTLRIRSAKVKEEIDLSFTEDFGNISFCIFCHNIRQVEISAINFSRNGEDSYNDKLSNFDFPFNNIYQYRYGTGSTGTSTELVNILKYAGVFIGYCNLVDINRCNFGVIGTEANAYGEIGDKSLSFGVIGDHSDCYIFNNKGNLKYYYINRDKCWYRLPVKGSLPDSDWGQIYEPETSVKPSGPGNVVGGNNGNRIEQIVGGNTIGDFPGIQKPSDDYNPPYIPENRNENIIPDLSKYYAAYSANSSVNNDFDLRSGSAIKDHMYIGPLSFSSPNNTSIYYRERNGYYCTSPLAHGSGPDYDSYANSGWKSMGCEIILDPSEISYRLNGAYDVNSIYLNFNLSKTSFAPEKFSSSDLKFYVKLVILHDGYELVIDNNYTPHLHYGWGSIELDKNGIDGFDYHINGFGNAGTFGILSDADKSPFTASGSNTGTGTTNFKIRLDNLTFDSDWIKQIEERYEYVVHGWYPQPESDWIHPSIFTNVLELFKQGKVIAIQFYPDTYDGQCLKLINPYLTINYVK